MATPVNSSVRRWLTPDVFAAIFLLLLCVVLGIASLQIREPDFGQLSPATWPRIIIGALTLLSTVFLIQSLRRSSTSAVDQTTTDNSINPQDKVAAENSPSPLRFKAFYGYWKNVIWCFTLFGLYLWTLPWLGMLVGACLFVFLLLTALGGGQPRQLLLHAAIALVTVGGMWSLFTYGLGVLLPSGSLFDFR